MPEDSPALLHPDRRELVTPSDDTAAESQRGRETLGEALRRAREAIPLSLREFTAAVIAHIPDGGPQINHVALWRIERGYVQTPNPAVIKACDAAAGTGNRLQELAASAQSTLMAAPRIPGGSDFFVGRTAEWDELDKFLDLVNDRRRVLSINGLPGVGKTEMVTQWYHATAERIAVQYPRACWVDLRGYDRDVRPLHPDTALESLLQQLNPARSIPSRAAKRAEMFYELCEQRPVLVILDNAATAEQVLPLIPPSAHCRTVVTSRDYLRLPEGEADSITLAPLAEQEAKQLLQHWVGNRITDEPSSAARVAALCGYLPLALTLVGEYLQRHRQLPVQALAQHLEQDGHRLDLPAAHTEHIRGTFLLSYRQLSERTREVFRLLGLHASPEIAVKTAAVLVDCPVADTRTQMEILANARLLERINSDRYRFHDLLREYAAERALHEDSDAKRAKAVDRVLHYYLRTASAATKTLVPHLRLPVAEPAAEFASHYDATQWLITEQSNLHDAAYQAVKRGEPAMCWHMAVAQGWEVALARTSWLNAHLLGLRAAQDSGDRLGVAWCLQNLGLHHCQLREWQSAKKYLTQALMHWCLIGDQLGQSWTLWAQAQLAAGQGNQHEALHMYQVLLDQGIDDDYFRATVQSSMGTVYCALPSPNPEAAVNSLQEALGFFVAESVPAAEAATLVSLATAWRQLRNNGKALRLLNRAYSCYASIGEQVGLADVLLRQAHIQLNQGDLSRARGAAVSALKMFASTNDPRAKDADDILAAIADIAP